nr:hypothetical protein [Tanacetum cinerariifolium]
FGNVQGVGIGEQRRGVPRSPQLADEGQPLGGHLEQQRVPGGIDFGIGGVEVVEVAQPIAKPGGRDFAGFEQVEQLGLAGLAIFDGAARPAEAAKGGGGAVVVDVDDDTAEIKKQIGKHAWSDWLPPGKVRATAGAHRVKKENLPYL